VVLAALAVRLPSLTDRPFHTDEAVNVFILEELFGEGYRYRAHDHHGPTLYYLSGAGLALAGKTDPAVMEAWMLRLFPAAWGALLAASVYLFRPYLSAGATHLAAGLLALSAPFVYYSGTYIHETLLLLFLVPFLACFWRMHLAPRPGAAVLSGLLAGLMLATKETSALLLLSAGAVLLVATRFTPGAPAASQPWRPLFAAYAGAGLAALAVVLLFYSGFGREPGRALDLFRAVGPQVGRGLGNEHAHPWWTYFSWYGSPAGPGLPWSGWTAALLGLAGLWLSRENRFLTALGAWGIMLAVLFCLLPYKTPWLALAWLLPFLILAGHALSRLFAQTRLAGILGSLLLATALGAETHARCHRQPVAVDNPLAYSPSSTDLVRLERDLEALAASTPEGRALPVHVIARDYWPLPWTLRRFPHVGFWSVAPELPVPDEAAVFVGPEGLPPGAELRPYELRPGVFIFFREPIAPASPTRHNLPAAPAPR
jgi:uncharacterized protein (TIGR03663 family)